jgi:hypothetical protein
MASSHRTQNFEGMSDVRIASACMGLGVAVRVSMAELRLLGLERLHNQML